MPKFCAALNKHAPECEACPKGLQLQLKGTEDLFGTCRDQRIEEQWELAVGGERLSKRNGSCCLLQLQPEWRTVQCSSFDQDLSIGQRADSPSSHDQCVGVGDAAEMPPRRSVAAA